jgi:hypothetical protein
MMKCIQAFQVRLDDVGPMTGCALAPSSIHAMDDKSLFAIPPDLLALAPLILFVL